MGTDAHMRRAIGGIAWPGGGGVRATPSVPGGRRVGVVVTDKGKRRCQWVLGAMASDLCGELGAGGDVELGEHVGQVGLHGPARDVQPVADLGVG